MDITDHEGGGSERIISELSGGAKIHRIFHETFPLELVKSETDDKELCRSIAYSILGATGLRVGFPSSKFFEVIIRHEIPKLLQPSLKCVDVVAAELKGVIQECSDGMFKYSRMREETERILTTYLREQEQICKDHLKLMIDIELSYLNTNHPDFIGFDCASNSRENGQKYLDFGSVNPLIKGQVEATFYLVKSYFGIVSKNIRDIVPKTIMHMMVLKMKEYIQMDLLPMIYASGDQDSLMEESQEAAMRRDEMIRMYHSCKDALSHISEVSRKTVHIHLPPPVSSSEQKFDSDRLTDRLPSAHPSSSDACHPII